MASSQKVVYLTFFHKQMNFRKETLRDVPRMTTFNGKIQHGGTHRLVGIKKLTII